MVFTDRLSYQLGMLVGDLIMFSFLPTSGFAAYKCLIKLSNSKCLRKLSNFANAHSISRFGADYVTENLFECLPYVD